MATMIEINNREQVSRDAMFLWCAENPFLRWSEATGTQQDAYERKARRVRAHMHDTERKL